MAAYGTARRQNGPLLASERSAVEAVDAEAPAALAVEVASVLGCCWSAAWRSR